MCLQSALKSTCKVRQNNALTFTRHLNELARVTRSLLMTSTMGLRRRYAMPGNVERIGSIVN